MSLHTRESATATGQPSVKPGPNTLTDPLSVANREVQEWQAKAADLRNQLKHRVAEVKVLRQDRNIWENRAKENKKQLQAIQKALYLPTYIDALMGRVEELARAVAKVEGK